MNLFIRLSFLTFFNLLLGAIVSSCSLSNYKEQVIGDYTIDEAEELRMKDDFIDYRILSINEDNTFELKQVIRKERLNGSWKIIGKDKEEISVEFIIKDKEVIGKFKDDNFNFGYPNDFFTGKYLKLTYLKLGQRINYSQNNPFNVAIEGCNCINNQNIPIEKRADSCLAFLRAKYKYFKIYKENDDLLYSWEGRNNFRNMDAYYDSINNVLENRGISLSVRDSAFWFGRMADDIGASECEFK